MASLLMLATLVLASCNHNEAGHHHGLQLHHLLALASSNHYEAGDLTFDTAKVSRVVHLFDDESKPADSIEIELVYVATAPREGFADSLNRMFLRTTLSEWFMDLPPQKSIAKYAQDEAEDYRGFNEEMFADYEREGRTDAYWFFEWFERTKGEVLLCQRDLLVFRTHYEGYTGGAHPNERTFYFNVDLRTLDILMLDDLFIDGYADALSDLLLAQMVEYYEMDSLQELKTLGIGRVSYGIPKGWPDSLHEDEESDDDLYVKPTGNFCLSKEGIVFHYNKYDITPGIVNPPHPCIPWSKLEGILRDDADILESVR